MLLRRLSILLAALLGVVAGFLVFTPENRVFPFPWHHDDWGNLGIPIDQIRSVRPLTQYIWARLSVFGPDALFAALYVLIAATVALSTIWTAEMLEMELDGWLGSGVAFLAGAVLMLFEDSPWSLRYTGHMSTALSATLAIASACAALGLDRFGRLGVLLMFVFATLSALSKEDGLLLPIVSLAVVMVDQYVREEWAACRKTMIFMGALAAILVGTLVYNVSVGSPFVLGSGPYQTSFRPSDLVDTLKWYLVSPTRFARNLGAFLVAATILSIALRTARPVRWLGVWVGILSLVVPYLPLFNHRYRFYCLNWLPIMTSALGWSLVAVARRYPSRRSRYVVAGIALCMFVSLSGISRKQREGVARSISEGQEWSRFAFAKAGAIIQKHPGIRYVVVDGADERTDGPWFANDGAYLNRALGSETRWIVIQRPGSNARRVNEELAWPLDRGRIVYVEEACKPFLASLQIPELCVGECPAAPPVADPPTGKDSKSCGLVRPHWMGG